MGTAGARRARASTSASASRGSSRGLSWLTILRKRPAFRRAFAGFEPDAVAAFGDDDVERLLADAGIVRHRGKIEAAIANARATVALREAGTPLEGCSGRTPRPAAGAALAADWPPRPRVGLLPAPASAGFRFVGPTTVYAAMQACGVVNDHLADCPVRARSSGSGRLMLDERVRAVLARLEAEDERDEAGLPVSERSLAIARDGRPPVRALSRQPGCAVLEIGGSRGYSTIWLGAAARLGGG